jgi:hypothetical protein
LRNNELEPMPSPSERSAAALLRRMALIEIVEEQ